MFQCKECDYKGNKAADNGSCPACDSYNIQRLGRVNEEEEDKYAKAKLWAVLLLWVVLAFLIIRKLID